MELLDRIKNNIERIAGLFAESPSLCSFFFMLVWHCDDMLYKISCLWFA